MTLGRRIMLSMLSVVAVSGGLATLLGGYLLWRSLSGEAEARVSQDLNAAQEFYSKRLEAISDALRFTAMGARFARAIETRELDYLMPRLEAVRAGANMDVLLATDAEGHVVCRAHKSPGGPETGFAARLSARAAQTGRPARGTILVPLSVLGAEAPPLVAQAKVPILPTPHAQEGVGGELEAGLMLAAVIPVRGAEGGKPVGFLRGGVLINRNHELVDQVQNTIFRNQQYKGKPLGVATLFQGDVRVSTTVPDEKGERALGTRVSAEVEDWVLRRGRLWKGRAWAVNEWYVTAYTPILDPDNRAVGMLGMGVLERKYTDAAVVTLLTFGLATVAALVVAGLVGWRLSANISRPVHALADAAKTVGQGEFSVPVAPMDAYDEIGTLVHAFDEMARSLKQRDEQIKHHTRMQLTRSERLAAAGRLSAGIAHEINNPLTGVLTFAHMLLRDAAPGSQQREDLQAIIDATTRCRDIVRGLLNFARQTEPQRSACQINKVMHEALRLTRNQAMLHGIAVVEEFAPGLPEAVLDPYQIQEVAVNAILNSIDAMAEGGTLTVRTGGGADDLGPFVEFQIIDTGCGISPENLDQVFAPFFTTKPAGKGTGLGLAISYGIVTEHGGDITLQSTEGQGATLRVRLPLTPKEDERESQDPGH